MGGGDKGTIFFFEVDFFEGIRRDSFISHIEVDSVENNMKYVPQGKVSQLILWSIVLSVHFQSLYLLLSFFKRWKTWAILLITEVKLWHQC